MLIVDGHAHIYEILRGFGPLGECRAIGGGRGRWPTGVETQFFPPKYGDLGFSAEALLDVMNANGVDKAVLLQASNYGFQNDYTAEVVKKYPDRFAGVGTLDPYCAKAPEILEHLIARLGFKSLKFEISSAWGLTGYHPDLRLDGKMLAPVFERAAQDDIAVAIDMGCMGTKSFDIPALIKVLKRHPKLTMVMTHLLFPCNDGKNSARLEMLKAMKCDRLYFDIANLPPMVDEPYPYVSQQQFICQAKGIIGAEHMIWGTDLPGVLNNYAYAQLRDYLFDDRVFNPSELEGVMGRNACRVYKIE